MLHPRKDKLPEGNLLCRSCNGTGVNAGRSDKRGNPLRCSKCKGRGMVADPAYVSAKERERQRRAQYSTMHRTLSSNWNDPYDTSAR
jgi:hypothetical protein